VQLQCEGETHHDQFTLPLHPSPPADLLSESLVPQVSVPISFTPTIPFHRSRVNIVIQRARSIGGGRWRYSLSVSAINPPDEVREGPRLTAHVGQRTEGRLEIVSALHAGQQFRSYFKSGASTEFALQPREGKFDSNGRAVISVIFNPTRYAGDRHCVVAVAHPTKQWLYSVVGELPPYDPPTGKSKVSSFRPEPLNSPPRPPSLLPKLK
jgi:hypothetical protein